MCFYYLFLCLIKKFFINYDVAHDLFYGFHPIIHLFFYLIILILYFYFKFKFNCLINSSPLL